MEEYSKTNLEKIVKAIIEKLEDNEVCGKYKLYLPSIFFNKTMIATINEEYIIKKIIVHPKNKMCYIDTPNLDIMCECRKITNIKKFFKTLPNGISELVEFKYITDEDYEYVKNHRKRHN